MNDIDIVENEINRIVGVENAEEFWYGSTLEEECAELKDLLKKTDWVWQPLANKQASQGLQGGEKEHYKYLSNKIDEIMLRMRDLGCQ